ncbi:MAG: heme ABC exporter ATP-binding protein CcmA [Chloroflexota bacterium]|nr:heme ABC exporter ATP-binding protein CcmA [Chloroflexota bacterium]
MITTRKLVKTFGRRPVLKAIDLEVPAGQSVALFGPNGAGKTTLIRIIAGLSKLSSGMVELGGHDVQKAGTGLRRYVGFVSHNPLVYDSLTGEENLQFFGRLYDVPDREQRIDEVLGRVGLWGRHKDLVRTYSRGMVQRLAIARAILHDPPVLLLDEPDTGLDQQAADMLRSLLVELGGSDRTVLLTTHNLERGIEWADRALILNSGRIRFDEPSRGLSSAQFRRSYGEVVGD